MGRPRRNFVDNQVYHVLNRANGRSRIFDTPEDYRAFESILQQGVSRFTMRLCAYCVMPNHWHLALWPRQGSQVGAFMQWVTLTHTQRWHAFRDSAGTGHLYQGRFKAFPVQGDAHLLKLFRYVEQNPLRAKLVKRAQEWPYGSLWQRDHTSAAVSSWLADWPLRIPRDWDESVNYIPDAAELAELRLAVNRGRPLGSNAWVQSTAARLGLESTLRRRGRPSQAKGHKEKRT